MHRHRIRAFVAGAGGGETDVPVTIFAAGQYLRFISGVGVMTTSLGPGTTVVNRIATWGDTTGTQLLQTPVSLDAAGNMTDLVTLDGQDAPNITAKIGADPTLQEITVWASTTAPWKLGRSGAKLNTTGDMTDVNTLNGRSPGILVGRSPTSTPAATSVMVHKDTTGIVSDATPVLIDSSGNMTGVGNINGQAPGNWVTGPGAVTTTFQVVTWNDTTGLHLGAASSIQLNSNTVTFASGGPFPGEIQNLVTLNGVTVPSGLWVQGPASSTDNRLATWSGTTGRVIKDASSITASAGAIANVSTINSRDPSRWVQGPSSSTANAFARFTDTAGTSVSSTSATVDGSGNMAGVTTINSRDPAKWVEGPSSATDNAVTRFDATTGKLVQSSSVVIDDSANVTGVLTLNGIDPAAWLKGVLTFFGGSTGNSAGYGLPKRASSYRVGFVAFVPVTFGDTTGTVSASMSSSDNNGTWGLHMPNSSAALPLGTGGSWPNPGTYANASFLFYATCVVPSGSGIYDLNLSISSSGSMTINTGWQVWAYQ